MTIMRGLVSGAPVHCDADHNWQYMSGYCYKMVRDQGVTWEEGQ